MTESTSIGPVGRQVIANVERLRKEQHVSLATLSQRLAAVGRSIGPTVLARQAQNQRRVDADDLVAFARVLGVTPAALLAAPEDAAADDHPAVLAARALAARLAAFVTAPGPQATERARADLDRGLRRVQLEVEELLAAAPPD